MGRLRGGIVRGMLGLLLGIFVPGIAVGQWHSSGTLHAANGVAWQQADASNRLATAADMVAAVVKEGARPFTTAPSKTSDPTQNSLRPASPRRHRPRQLRRYRCRTLRRCVWSHCNGRSNRDVFSSIRAPEAVYRRCMGSLSKRLRYVVTPSASRARDDRRAPPHTPR